MAFCSNCGKKLELNDRFCSGCGHQVGKVETNQRSIEYEGTIYKCPNCGEILNAFDSNCPSCGHEIRGSRNSDAINEFAQNLMSTNDYRRKISIIRDFPVPNNKEDILEFMIMAMSNIEDNLTDDISDAWQTKIEQIYQKACIIFKSESEFARLHYLYSQSMDRLKKRKAKRKLKNTNDEIVELLPELPNTLFVLGWLISILILIPACRVNLDNVGTNVAQLIVIVDLIIGAIFVPTALKRPYHLTRIIAVIGLIFSIVVIIPECSKNLDNVGFNMFQLILMIDIICSAIISGRMLSFKIKEKNRSGINRTSIVFVLIATIVMILVYAVTSIVTSIKEKNQQREYERIKEEEYSVQYEWPSTGMSTYLPKPDTRYGKIKWDQDKQFNIVLYKFTTDDFENYVKKCKRKGFVIDTVRLDNVFYAYNEEGHELNMFYKEDEQSLEIYISKNEEN